MRIERSIARSIKMERRLASTIDGGDEAGYSLPRRVIMLRSNLHGKLRQCRKNDFLLAWASNRNFSVGKSVSFFRREPALPTEIHISDQNLFSLFLHRYYFRDAISSISSFTFASNLFGIALLNTLLIIKYYYVIITDGWVNQKLFIK